MVMNLCGGKLAEGNEGFLIMHRIGSLDHKDTNELKL